MTSTTNPMNFILTPQQQNLLFAALNSNRQTSAQTSALASLSPTSFNSFQNSPEIDYEYDFGGADSSFDFFDNGSQPKMIGDLPAPSATARSDSGEAESPDKRSHPDDDEEETSSPKRRESEDKVAKKPGRKPLTTEPSSKRKAQNRAAQRAFRERKEKHLKDLETKVQELEAASQAANHENDLLRAQVDKMTVELSEYKKRVTLMSKEARPTRSSAIWGAPLTSGIGDVNFHFEFPKFGPLSGASSSTQSKKSSLSPVPGSGQSPVGQSTNLGSPGQNSQTNKEDLSALTNGLFSPPLTNQNMSTSRNNSSDSQYSAGGAASTSSPSASSNSNMGGPSSSCGTSPEPFTQSPMGFKPVDTLTTIGEEQASTDASTGFDQFGNVNLPDFNWLPQNFEFDPQLFGDYREPQENILGSGVDDAFFNDAFDIDFTTPYNLPSTTPAAPAAPKKDLIAEIDAAKEQDEVEPSSQMLTCNKIWEKLQNCPRVQNGDFDLDGLCSDLQKKAKCSGTGAVVDEKDFKLVMKKYLGERKTDEELEKCTRDVKA